MLKWLRLAGLTTGGVLLLAAVTFTVLNQLYPFETEGRGRNVVTVYAAEGDVLRQFANENGIYRIPVSPGQVSPWYLRALLAYEDRHFYSHPGVNPLSLLRAFGQQLYYGRVISGGSTLTMQVARLFYPHPRSYLGKLEQIFRALQLELRYSKSDILALYLTYAPMGGNIEGVEAASQRYFGKHASELSPTEAAMLVVVPQRPSLYRPDRFPLAALQARNKVLRRVAGVFSWSTDELLRMQQSPLRAAHHPAPMFSPLLARHLQKQFPQQSDIQTFINFTLQHGVENMLRQHTAGWATPLSAAVMVMENRSGKVLAYKGSADIYDARRYGYVDMVQAWRSPGSALKPFIYGLALERRLVHSASLLTDVPRAFGDYRPQNFDHHYEGAIRLDTALQHSRNIPAVQVLSQVGPGNFLHWLQNSGVQLRVADANLAIALGGLGVRLTDMVALFSALSREGELIFPRLSVEEPVRTHGLLSPAGSWIITHILQDIAPPDRVKPAHGRRVAWKTGTSYGFRDAWAVGTSDDYTVGVWVGRPDGAPFVGQTGANQAAPLMFDVFDLLPKDRLQRPRPSQVAEAVICWPGGIDAALVRTSDCLLRHQAFTIDHHTPPTLRQSHDFTHLHQWPQVIQDWFRKTGQSLPAQAPLAGIKILSPPSGAQLFPYRGQTLALVASKVQAEWYLDERPLTRAALELDGLSDGHHRLTACSVQCDSIEIWIASH
ncbi:penicillin-binding protein 1C [Vibrio mangrovi]|uniref:peptidoglycan glycosyltransferase n=1 Tax=Vibrio mangrovi TaxID=474394 RepID=A0A1Y6IWS7_9VIBR|nr:penicillin-binding protein 1C [Vibrio mangrovi]MDW6005452.1 penicillin-binding protein 1C [Vibrio mangrovi]SMS02107.1 Penicillin-binding protein 1F [Vibrio mangrovi]